MGSTTQDRKSEQRIKRIKTANGVALPEAARGLLNKDNANKRVLHLLQLPQQEMRFEWGTMCFQLLLRGYHQGIYRKLIQTKKATFLKKILQPWADSPILRRSIAASRSIDPATVITNNPKLIYMRHSKVWFLPKRPGIACCNSKHATTRKRYEEILSTTGIHSIVVLFKKRKKNCAYLRAAKAVSLFHSDVHLATSNFGTT